MAKSLTTQAYGCGRRYTETRSYYFLAWRRNGLGQKYIFSFNCFKNRRKLAVWFKSTQNKHPLHSMHTANQTNESKAVYFLQHGGQIPNNLPLKDEHLINIKSNYYSDQIHTHKQLINRMFEWKMSCCFWQCALSTRLSALVPSHIPVPNYTFTSDGRHEVFAGKKWGDAVSESRQGAIPEW